LETQEGESADLMGNMLDSLTRIRNRQTPKLQEINELVQIKGSESKPRISEEELTPTNNSGAMEIERKKSESPSESKKKKVTVFIKKPNQPSKYRNISSETQAPEAKAKSTTEGHPLIIPWKGRILTPTPNQLRQYEGDLNEIAKNLGS